MNVSFLIITYNRRAGLLANLTSLFAVEPRAEVWIVDNASTDGTSDVVRETFPQTRLIQLDKNIGMPARNVALNKMTSEYVVLLDDDSYPLSDAVVWSTAYMDVHRDVAAVVGRAELPDGSFEAPAMPGVMLGCATCIRLRAIRDVGFFPNDFFRQAEEYDLSLRLWDAGHRVKRFEDIRYRHDKKPSASRASREVGKLDLKHNLILAARHLPAPFDGIYWNDFEARYRAILSANGFADECDNAVAEAKAYAANTALLRRQPINKTAFEALFEHRAQLDRIAEWSRATKIRRVAIADYSKNLYATYCACEQLGLQVAAVIDDRAAFAGSTYRGLPVVRPDAMNERIDGVIVSNTNPSQVDRVASALHPRFGPPLTLWSAKYVKPVSAFESRRAA